MRARAGTAIGSIVAVVAASLASMVVLAGPAGATAVTDEASLRAAFFDDAEVVLLNDITLTTCTGADDSVYRDKDDPVVVEGNGFTITQTCDDDRLFNNGGNGTTTLRNVTLAASSGAIESIGPIVGEGLVVDGRANTTVSIGVNSQASVTLIDSEVKGFSAPVVYAVATSNGDVSLTRTVVHSITASQIAVGVYDFDGSVALTDSTVRDIVGGTSAAIGVVSQGDTVVVRSTVTRVSAPTGAIGLFGFELRLQESTVADITGDDLGGAGVYADSVRVENSTITGVNGPAVFGEDATVVYSDLVANGGENVQIDSAAVEAAAEAAGLPSFAFDEPPAGDPVGQIQAATLTIFGSVVTDANVGLPNCEVDAVTSQGYNFADDTSCELTATGDRQGGGLDPLLGPLADNGGPTATFLPQAGSPLLEAIPAAACQSGAAAGITIDQRGEPRPGFTACDIGSVELQPAPVIEPTFTG